MVVFPPKAYSVDSIILNLHLSVNANSKGWQDTAIYSQAFVVEGRYCGFSHRISMRQGCVNCVRACGRIFCKEQISWQTLNRRNPLIAGGLIYKTMQFYGWFHLLCPLERCVPFSVCCFPVSCLFGFCFVLFPVDASLLAIVSELFTLSALSGDSIALCALQGKADEPFCGITVHRTRPLTLFVNWPWSGFPFFGLSFREFPVYRKISDFALDFLLESFLPWFAFIIPQPPLTVKRFLNFLSIYFYYNGHNSLIPNIYSGCYAHIRVMFSFSDDSSSHRPDFAIPVAPEISSRRFCPRFP